MSTCLGNGNTQMFTDGISFVPGFPSFFTCTISARNCDVCDCIFYSGERNGSKRAREGPCDYITTFHYCVANVGCFVGIG